MKMVEPCRLCGESGTFPHIINKKEPDGSYVADFNLSFKITYCLDIHVGITDRFLTLCQVCRDKVELVFSFKSLAKTTQEKLKDFELHPTLSLADKRNQISTLAENVSSTTSPAPKSETPPFPLMLSSSVNGHPTFVPYQGDISKLIPIGSPIPASSITQIQKSSPKKLCLPVLVKAEPPSPTKSEPSEDESTIEMPISPIAPVLQSETKSGDSTNVKSNDDVEMADPSNTELSAPEEKKSPVTKTVRRGKKRRGGRQPTKKTESYSNEDNRRRSRRLAKQAVRPRYSAEYLDKKFNEDSESGEDYEADEDNPDDPEFRLVVESSSSESERGKSPVNVSNESRSKSPIINRPPEVKCPSCPRSFTSEKFLKKHEETHKTQDTKCQKCFKEFKTRGELERHEDENHPNEHWACTPCLAAFVHLKSYRAHLKTHVETCVKVCPNCNVTYTYLAAYERHVSTCKQQDSAVPSVKPQAKVAPTIPPLDPNRPFKCAVCSGLYATEAELDEHIKVHSRNKGPPFVCKEGTCTEEFETKGQLICHRAFHHKQKGAESNPEVIGKKQCPECKEYFDNSGDLICHQVLNHKKH